MSRTGRRLRPGGKSAPARHHRLLAARAHLRERAGDGPAAAADHLEAARRATSLPERRYLAVQAARLEAAARQAG